MPEDTCPVQWTGRQAVVTLPQHVDRSNAGQIREQLLWTINRGAAMLIVDLAATISCDYSGADALVRAYHRAAASGTELELVAMSAVVRRVLRLSGLDRLVSVYPSLEAAIARAERPEASGQPAPAAATPAGPGLAGQLQAAAQRVGAGQCPRGSGFGAGPPGRKPGSGESRILPRRVLGRTSARAGRMPGRPVTRSRQPAASRGRDSTSAARRSLVPAADRADLPAGRALGRLGAPDTVLAIADQPGLGC